MYGQHNGAQLGPSSPGNQATNPSANPGIGNRILNPTLPYLGSVPKLTDGLMIVIQGRIKPKCSQLFIQLRSGSDVAFHLAPMLNDAGGGTAVVCNSNEGGRWGLEEKCTMSMSLKKEEHFECLILVTKTSYRIAFCGAHVCEFRHRVALERVDSLSIQGDVQIQTIFYKMSGTNPDQSKPVPYSGPVTKLTDGQMIVIQGKTLPTASQAFLHLISRRRNRAPADYMQKCSEINPFNPRIWNMTLYNKNFQFFIQLKIGMGDVALHLAPIFNEAGGVQVVCNSNEGGRWGLEEKFTMNTPLRKGEMFECNILVTRLSYRVSFNNAHLCDFRHRIALEKVTSLSIQGDVQIQSVNFKSSGTNSNQSQQIQSDSRMLGAALDPFAELPLPTGPLISQGSNPRGQPSHPPSAPNSGNFSGGPSAPAPYPPSTSPSVSQPFPGGAAAPYPPNGPPSFGHPSAPSDYQGSYNNQHNSGFSDFNPSGYGPSGAGPNPGYPMSSNTVFPPSAAYSAGTSSSGYPPGLGNTPSSASPGYPQATGNTPGVGYPPAPGYPAGASNFGYPPDSAGASNFAFSPSTESLNMNGMAASLPNINPVPGNPSMPGYGNPAPNPTFNPYEPTEYASHQGSLGGAPALGFDGIAGGLPTKYVDEPSFIEGAPATNQWSKPANQLPAVKRFTNGIRTDQVISITAHPRPTSTWLTLTLKPDEHTTDVDFYLFIDFATGRMTRNNRTGTGWGQEETFLPCFPITRAQTFSMLVLCQPQVYRVAINNAHLLEFWRKTPQRPLSTVTHACLAGDFDLISFD